MRSEIWTGVKRLLVASPGGAAEVHALMSSLGIVKRVLPGTRITLFVPRPEGVTPQHALAGEELIVGRLAWHSEPTSSVTSAELSARGWRGISRLRARRFDVALIFGSASYSPYPVAYACLLAGIPIRAGLSSEFGGAALSHWVRPLPEPPATLEDQYLLLLRAVGLLNAVPAKQYALEPETQVLAPEAAAEAEAAEEVSSGRWVRSAS